MPLVGIDFAGANGGLASPDEEANGALSTF
jgi:hypothetical protein